MGDQDTLIPKHGGYRKLKSFRMAQLVYDVTVRFCERYIDRRSRTHDQMVQAARSGVQNIAEGSQASGTSKKMELKLTNVARASLEELRLDYEDFLRQRGLPLWEPDHPALKRFKGRRCTTLEGVRAWVAEERCFMKDRTVGTTVDKDKHGLAPVNTGEGRRAPMDTDEHGLTRTEKDEYRLATMDTDKHGRAPVDTDKRGRARTSTEGERGKFGYSMSVSVGGGRCESIPSYCLVANAALSLLNLCCYLLDRQLAAQAAVFEQEGGFTERLYRQRRNRRKGK